MSNIYIDVGHGLTGSDTGTSGTLKNGKVLLENEQNLIIAKAVKSELEKCGHVVTLSRTENKNITAKIGDWGQSDSNLIASADNCKRGNFDLMISIHNNWAENVSARGYQLFYKTGDGKEAESKKLAENVGASLDRVVPKNLIGTKTKNGSDVYGILRLHDKVGVLIECVFMTNQQDLELLNKSQNEIGRAIADGIKEYTGENSSHKCCGGFKMLERTSFVEKDGVKYYAEIRADKTVRLTVTKYFDVVSKLKSGALFWNSVLNRGTDPILYYVKNMAGDVVRLTFKDIIGVSKGESFSHSNANTYAGAVTSNGIEAWYLSRGTNARLKGFATIEITGFVSDELFKTLM